MDFADLDATSIASLVVCGVILLIAVIRFIIHLISKNK